MYICRYWTGGVPRSRTPSTSWRRTTSELQETVNPGLSRRSPCGRYSYENCSVRLSCDSYKTKFHLVVLPHSLPNKYRNFSYFCIKCQIHFIVTLDIIIQIMLIFNSLWSVIEWCFVAASLLWRPSRRPASSATQRSASCCSQGIHVIFVKL